MRRLLLLLLCAPAYGATYHQILATGQSLSMGCFGYPALTSTYQSNKGLTAGSTDLEAAGVHQRDQSPLIALAPWLGCNNTGGDPGNGASDPDEIPVVAAVNQLTFATGGASGNRYIASMHGMSGRIYTVIAGPTETGPSGTAPFINGQLQVTTAQSAVTGGGDTYVLDAVLVEHGETDDNTGNAVTASGYEGYLAHWQWDYERASNASTGRQGVLPMFVSQVNAWGFYRGSGTVAQAAVGQWLAGENYPGKIFLTTPKYFLPTSGTSADGVHLTNAGYQWLGELDGDAMYQVLVLGNRWIPLSPKTITISGAVITAKFWVPVGTLAVDTTVVSDQGNGKGFEFRDSNGAGTISSVSVSGDTATITLSGTPNGTSPTLAYARTAPAATGGGKGNIRDSNSATSLSGRSLAHWLVTFDAPLPFTSKLQSVNTKPATGALSISSGVAR